MRKLAILLTFIYPIVAIYLWSIGGGPVVEDWLTWKALNLLFIGTIPFVCSFVVAKMFLDVGYLPLLFLACGLGSQSICYFLGSATGATDINTLITVFNGGALIGSFFHFISAMLGSMRGKGIYFTVQSHLTKWFLTIELFGVILLLSIAWSVIAHYHLTPVFFVQGSGGTLIRSCFVIASALFYGASAGLFAYLYGQWKSKFQFWYILMLTLFAMCNCLFLVQDNIGDYLSWWARVGLWLGGTFFATAAFTVLKQGWRKKMEETAGIIAAFLSVRNGHSSDMSFKLSMHKEFEKIKEFKEKYGVLPHQAYIMMLEGSISSLDDLTRSGQNDGK